MLILNLLGHKLCNVGQVGGQDSISLSWLELLTLCVRVKGLLLLHSFVVVLHSRGAKSWRKCVMFGLVDLLLREGPHNNLILHF